MWIRNDKGLMCGETPLLRLHGTALMLICVLKKPLAMFSVVLIVVRIVGPWLLVIIL
jgi:hypothetical protein